MTATIHRNPQCFKVIRALAISHSLYLTCYISLAISHSLYLAVQTLRECKYKQRNARKHDKTLVPSDVRNHLTVKTGPIVTETTNEKLSAGNERTNERDAHTDILIRDGVGAFQLNTLNSFISTSCDKTGP